MKLYWFASYILVYLLTHSHWNLVVPVKAGEDASKSEDADASKTEAGEATESQPENVTETKQPDDTESEVSTDVGSSEGSDTGQAHTAKATATEFKLYKDDGNGNPIEMQYDFNRQDFLLTQRFEFKNDVKCVLIKFGDKEVWKKGGQDISEPKVIISINNNYINVRDLNKFANFMRKNTNNEWECVRKSGDNSGNSANQSQSGSTNAKSVSAEGSGEASEQSKDASAEAGSSPDAGSAGESGTTPDADSSGGDGSTDANEQDSSSAPAE
ncbi:hypothetical protein TOT_010000648 [Theileria orientalis strain Shintoku]|uniref:Uncharacterized protein n=1 Tax=Theileria orientalis strain Shintoku TaxID=869250 RepID=J4C7K3_THEOR|nr:hypothetical protein TOT_010000648 [Theileria orientalis strain Shintoku]BAM39188.1 hypothetical protein TOT_010000648 [Theileria orientalis strain Shintoku]|eukprot:XP_009689489.1 hypothetical protein TOT_010000648 [Theileria orientalis strain Shintoku]